MLKKIKNRIKDFILKDYFAFTDKNRLNHLRLINKIAKEHKSNFKFEKIANYKVPINILVKFQKNNFKNLLTAGVEFHIEFEEIITKRFNKKFYLFEIDKRSYEWFNSHHSDNKQLILKKYGISDETKIIECWGSKNKKFSSSMSTDFINKHSEDYVYLHNSNVLNVIDLMKDCKIDKIDFLKLDIEGEAEKVLNFCYKNNVFPEVIFCEFERAVNDKFSDYSKRINTILDKYKDSYSIYLTKRDDQYNAFTIELWMDKKYI